MKLDTVLTTTLIICAVFTSGVVVKREFSPSPQNAPMSGEEKPTLVAHWQDYLDKGVRMGPAKAKVQLIEFADFECPYCGSFHKILKTLRDRYPDQVSLDYVHFPLPMHRFAIPAARVAECAGEQGRFESMYDRLFEQQDSFGLKPWSEFAAEAGVPDGDAFENCIRRTEPIPRVVAGRQLGKALDVQGTPTLIVNGWKLGHPPSEVELEAMVKAVLAGKEPVSGGHKS
jgi:Na+:H+ antiporter, NhaA family